MNKLVLTFLDEKCKTCESQLLEYSIENIFDIHGCSNPNCILFLPKPTDEEINLKLNIPQPEMADYYPQLDSQDLSLFEKFKKFFSVS